MFKDSFGNTWGTAEEALNEFISDLPDMSEEDTESVFQFTHWQNSAADNLKAIDYGITYSAMWDTFKNYPLPYPAH